MGLFPVLWQATCFCQKCLSFSDYCDYYKCLNSWYCVKLFWSCILDVLELFAEWKHCILQWFQAHPNCAIRKKRKQHKKQGDIQEQPSVWKWRVNMAITETDAMKSVCFIVQPISNPKSRLCLYEASGTKYCESSFFFTSQSCQTIILQEFTSHKHARDSVQKKRFLFSFYHYTDNLWYFPYFWSKHRLGAC